VTRIAKETLPKGFAFEWTELTYQEIIAGNSGMLVFPLAILLVFLVLAAQYESLTLPIVDHHDHPDGPARRRCSASG
jgi:multidrug efflux pump